MTTLERKLKLFSWAALLFFLAFSGVSADPAADHWAFRPLNRPVIPQPVASNWARTPIDSFILKKQEAQGLRPNPELDRRGLLRRIYFDVIGLPPAPEEVESFVDDPAPDAFEKRVDQLLQNPHYGERWGRHWLDVARYADSMGYRFDDNTPSAYAYRDFVINAINQDLPFDQFIRWQLAGDELAPDHPPALAATGFCAVGPRERDEGTARNRLETRYNELDDIVSTAFSATLALSMNCARCHDHKYDPISQREYYQVLKAFKPGRRTQVPMRTLEERIQWAAWEQEREASDRAFASWRRENSARLAPILAESLEPLLEESRRLEAVFAEKYSGTVPNDPQKLAQLVREQGRDVLSQEQHRRYQQLERDLEKKTEQTIHDRNLMREGLPQELFEEWAAWRGRKAKILAEKPRDPQLAHAYVDAGVDPAPSHLLIRGDPDRKAEEVPLGFLQVLSAPGYEPAPAPEGAAGTFQRAALAEWLTDVDAGAGRLLARVTANRLWHFHFGEGLVRTLNDFGTQGEPPALPELLDWLAVALIESGWSLKAMHKLILNSAVYQQNNDDDAARAALDPENRFWWRRAPLRLEAEILRDSILAVTGRLNPVMHGPGVMLPVPPDLILSRLGQSYPTDIQDGPDTWRRSVYAFYKRTVPVPMFQVFDAPDGSSSCARRFQTTVAPQALLLMNDDFIRSRSRDFAKRLEMTSEREPARAVRHAFSLALSRSPTEQEVRRAMSFLETQTALHGGDAREALADFCQTLLCLNEFIYID
jgi:hypothetical protein